MALTPTQSATLRADIQADPTLSALPDTADDAYTIALAYNATATPDFWVLRTSVREAEYTSSPSPDGTSWSWTAYIARSLQEQNAWARMFMGTGQVNPSLANVQQGFADIFSGSQNAAMAQRAHLQACSRRRATRVEKLLAKGAGTTTGPATMDFEGTITYQDVQAARKLP